MFGTISLLICFSFALNDILEILIIQEARSPLGVSKPYTLPIQDSTNCLLALGQLANLPLRIFSSA